MTQRNALMEWLDQTKKLSKTVDYQANDLIDSIIAVLPYLDRKVLLSHRDFLEYYCAAYHKPNPLKIKTFDKPKLCPEIKRVLPSYVDQSIRRIERQREAIVWQFYEVIDFIYERPELVNPSAIDEYVRNQIYEVCKQHKKNNPFENGIANRLGKFWKDEKGKWRPERRKRF